MKTLKHYNNESEVINDKTAVKDVRQYLGDKTWKALQSVMNYVDAGDSITNFYGAMMITGIEGYPVEALKRTFLKNRLEDFEAYDAEKVVEAEAA
jgi:hypothetical protein